MKKHTWFVGLVFIPLFFLTTVTRDAPNVPRLTADQRVHHLCVAFGPGAYAQESALNQAEFQRTGQEREQSATEYYSSVQKALQTKDYDLAEALLQRLLTKDSRFQEVSGKSAWYLLGHLIERQGDKLDAMHTLEQGRDSLLTQGKEDWYLNYDLARLLAENGVEDRDGEITELVNEVLVNSTPADQNDLWQLISHDTFFLLDEPERSQFQQALAEPGGQPGMILLRYFRESDPTPFTPQNEILAVYFRRLAEAKAEFPSQLTPGGFDDRGMIFVRYGKPWRVHTDHSGIMGDVGWEIHPYEVWFYATIHPDLYFTFMRENGQTGYTLVDGPESIFGVFYKGRRTFFNRRNVGQKAMALRDNLYRNLAPSHETFRQRLYQISNFRSTSEALDYSLMRFAEDDRVHAAQLDTLAPIAIFKDESVSEPLPIEVSLARFRDENLQTRAEIYYSIPYAALFFEDEEGRYRSGVRGEIGIFDEDFVLIARDSIDQHFYVAAESAKKRGTFLSQWNFHLPPGKYHMYFRIENIATNRIAKVRSDFAVSSFPQTALSLSDIQLSPNIEATEENIEFAKRGLLVVPLPGETVRKGGPLYVYYEIYNLATDASGRTNYEIEYRVQPRDQSAGFFKKLAGIFGLGGSNKKSITLSEKRTGDSSLQTEYVRLDLAALTTGEKILQIAVNDLNINQKVTTQVGLRLRDADKD